MLNLLGGPEGEDNLLEACKSELDPFTVDRVLEAARNSRPGSSRPGKAGRDRQMDLLRQQMPCMRHMVGGPQTTIRLSVPMRRALLLADVADKLVTGATLQPMPSLPARIRT